jgi:hypothetical protein
MNYDMISDLPNFDYDVIIHNEQQGTRERKSFNSISSWYTIQDRLAEVFGIHPTQLHAQYRFSTDKKGDLPYNLRGQADLDSLVKYLQLTLPNRKQGRSQKMPNIEIFNKTIGIVNTNSTATVTVCTIFSSFNTYAVRIGTGSSAPPQIGNRITERGFLGETSSTVTKTNSVWDERKKIREIIIETNKCAHHSLPDKPVVCW